MVNFTEEDGIEISKALYKHAHTMLKQSVDALEKMLIAQAIIEFKTPWVWEKKQEKNKNEIMTTDHVIDCSKEEFNKSLCKLLAEDFSELKGFSSLHFFLNVGMRYYVELMKNDNQFSLVKDLPKLLTVDEGMCRMFSQVTGMMIFSHKFTQDKSRTKASNNTRFNQAEKSKLRILETIKKISKTDHTKRTLNGWATQIIKNFEGTVSLSSATAIMKEEFKEKLTNGPRVKFHLSELIS